jgi:phage baseplate assembly protein W
MQKYYKLPLPFNALLKKKRPPVCSMQDSIKQNIHLILYTKFGEHRYNYSFGCEIWNKNFENIHSISKWKDGFKDSILNSLEQNETRLEDVKITMYLKDSKTPDQETKMAGRYRMQIIIKIEGIIYNINEAFQHWENIYFSPLSMI